MHLLHRPWGFTTRHHSRPNPQSLPHRPAHSIHKTNPELGQTSGPAYCYADGRRGVCWKPLAPASPAHETRPISKKTTEQTCTWNPPTGKGLPPAALVRILPFLQRQPMIFTPHNSQGYNAPVWVFQVHISLGEITLKTRVFFIFKIMSGCGKYMNLAGKLYHHHHHMWYEYSNPHQCLNALIYQHVGQPRARIPPDTLPVTPKLTNKMITVTLLILQLPARAEPQPPPICTLYQ